MLWLGVAPATQALQILRWERMPLAVPLRVGEERVVFIDRNVRVGVPAAIADHLRGTERGRRDLPAGQRSDRADPVAVAGRRQRSAGS